MHRSIILALLNVLLFHIIQKLAAEFIKREDIVRAIEEALANPLNYNFAIDLEGFVYRGAETSINNIPEDKREKLSTAN